MIQCLSPRWQIGLLNQVSRTRKQIAQLIGTVFIHKSNVNLLSSVLDTPEYFWCDSASPKGMWDLSRLVCQYVACSGMLAWMSLDAAQTHEGLILQGCSWHTSTDIQASDRVRCCYHILAWSGDVHVLMGLCQGLSSVHTCADCNAGSSWQLPSALSFFPLKARIRDMVCLQVPRAWTACHRFE